MLLQMMLFIQFDDAVADFLIYLVFNGVKESTGGQDTVASAESVTLIQLQMPLAITYNYLDTIHIAPVQNTYLLIADNVANGSIQDTGIACRSYS